MVSLRGTLANLGLRYEIDLVKQQGGPMPELSSSGAPDAYKGELTDEVVKAIKRRQEGEDVNTRNRKG